MTEEFRFRNYSNFGQMSQIYGTLAIKSTIHVGKYIPIPWIRHGRRNCSSTWWKFRALDYGHFYGISWVWPPRTIPSLVGFPINLQLPLLLGGGHTQGISITLFYGIYQMECQWLSIRLVLAINVWRLEHHQDVNIRMWILFNVFLLHTILGESSSAARQYTPEV